MKLDRYDWRMIGIGVAAIVIAVALFAILLFVIPVPN